LVLKKINKKISPHWWRIKQMSKLKLTGKQSGQSAMKKESPLNPQEGLFGAVFKN
jgi:hypothetical protein